MTRIQLQRILRRFIFLGVLICCLFILSSTSEQITKAYAMPLCSDCEELWRSYAANCQFGCGDDLYCRSACNSWVYNNNNIVIGCFAHCVFDDPSLGSLVSCGEASVCSGSCCSYQLFCCGNQQLCDGGVQYYGPCP